MPTYKELKQKGYEIAEKLLKIPGVLAIVYTGSVANGFADAYSKDVDLMCLCRKIPSLEERRNVLGKRKYEVEGLASPYIESFKDGKIKVDIIFKQLDWFDWALNLMDPYNEESEKNNLFVIQEIEPIFDENGIIENLKERAKYTPEYRKKKIEFQFSVLCNAGHIIKDQINRKNNIFVNNRLADYIRRYASLIYALNYKYFSDLKWVEKTIENFDIKPINAVENMKKISELGNTIGEIAEKQKILKNMIYDVSKIIKKETPEIKIDNIISKLDNW